MAGNEKVARKVMREEIMGALKKMKGVKAAGMDCTIVEMLKFGSINIIEWLLRIFNTYMESVLVFYLVYFWCIVPI